VTSWPATQKSDGCLVRYGLRFDLGNFNQIGVEDRKTHRHLMSSTGPVDNRLVIRLAWLVNMRGGGPYSAQVRSVDGLTWLDRPERRFDVTLRSHELGSPMDDAKQYRWHGSATDEAHAVTSAMNEAATDGWADTTSYRVCECVEFLPVPSESDWRAS